MLGSVLNTNSYEGSPVRKRLEIRRMDERINVIEDKL
jgi:hypothetical protein